MKMRSHFAILGIAVLALMTWFGLVSPGSAAANTCQTRVGTPYPTWRATEGNYLKNLVFSGGYDCDFNVYSVTLRAYGLRYVNGSWVNYTSDEVTTSAEGPYWLHPWYPPYPDYCQGAITNGQWRSRSWIAYKKVAGGSTYYDATFSTTEVLSC
jgi:hypothetical protein